MFTIPVLPLRSAKAIAKTLGCKPGKLRWGFFSSDRPASQPPCGLDSVVLGRRLVGRSSVNAPPIGRIYPTVDAAITTQTTTVWLVAYSKKAHREYQNLSARYLASLSSDTEMQPFVAVAPLPQSTLEAYAQTVVLETIIEGTGGQVLFESSTTDYYCRILKASNSALSQRLATAATAAVTAELARQRAVFQSELASLGFGGINATDPVELLRLSSEEFTQLVIQVHASYPNATLSGGFFYLCGKPAGFEAAWAHIESVYADVLKKLEVVTYSSIISSHEMCRSLATLVGNHSLFELLLMADGPGHWEEVQSRIVMAGMPEDPELCAAVDEFITNCDTTLEEALGALEGSTAGSYGSPETQLHAVAALRKSPRSITLELGPELVQRMSSPFRILAIRTDDAARQHILSSVFSATLEDDA